MKFVGCQHIFRKMNCLFYRPLQILTESSRQPFSWLDFYLSYGYHFFIYCRYLDGTEEFPLKGTLSRMSITHKKLAPWITAALMTLLFFGVLALTQYFRYENSDDLLFVKAFMGYEGGVPAGFTLYTHTIFAKPLQWLSLAFPGVAWFSVLELSLLWLGCLVTLKSIIQCAQSNQQSLWVGCCLGALFLLVFSIFSLCRINYTTTSAMVGAAAIPQLLSVARPDVTNGQILRGTLFSFFLLICCYCMRQFAVLPILLFWLLALGFVYVALRKQAMHKCLICPLLMGGLVFILLIGLREVEIDTLKQRDFLSWQKARINLMDYHEPAFDLVSDEVLAEMGWTSAELSMVRGWYFMDQNITTEALNRLSQVHRDATRHVSFPQKLGDAVSQTLGFFPEHPAYLLSGALLITLCALCVILSLDRRRREVWTALLCLAILPLTAAMLVYLPFQGRLLSRGVDCAFFPAGAFLFSISASRMDFRLTKNLRPQRRLLCLLCVLCLCFAAGSSVHTYRQLQARPDKISATRQAALETYGLAHPNQLVLYAPNLLRDTRLFPDVSGGIPQNLMLWGDWYCRTPSWKAQLTAYGMDIETFSAKDFLRDNLVYVSAEETPFSDLMTYLAEGVGRPVRPERIHQADGLSFFQFK